MTCRRLLTGLGSAASTLADCREFSGRLAGICSQTDFFLRRKKADDFLVMVCGSLGTVVFLELGSFGGGLCTLVDDALARTDSSVGVMVMAS